MHALHVLSVLNTDIANESLAVTLTLSSRYLLSKRYTVFLAFIPFAFWCPHSVFSKEKSREDASKKKNKTREEEKKKNRQGTDS